MVSFIITTGRKRWYDIGAYVSPNNLPMINLIRQALECEPNGDEEAACRQPQRLPVKSEGPARRTTSNRPRGTWPHGPSTTMITKTEVSSGGELDVENVKGGETYLGAGILHIRDTK